MLRLSHSYCLLVVFELYLLEYGPDRRHQVRRWGVGVTGSSLRQLLRCLHVGPMDVLEVTDGQLGVVPFAGALPLLLGDGYDGDNICDVDFICGTIVFDY